MAKDGTEASLTSAEEIASKEDVTVLIREHAEWLEHGGLSVGLLFPDREIESLRAVKNHESFVGANFENANLSWSSFTSCQFSDKYNAFRAIGKPSSPVRPPAKFINATLIGANFRHSTFDGVDFNGADLHDAFLQSTSLVCADLSKAKGLLSERLAQADLTGAKLPEDIARFDALTNLSAQVDVSKRLWFALLLAGIFICLSLADQQTSFDLKLPIIDTRVSSKLFYPSACLVILVLYSYFQIYLQRLWEIIAQLPVRFPDGTYVDQKMQWIVGAFVRECFPKCGLLAKRGFDRLEWIIAIISTFFIVPISIGVVGTLYLWRTDLIFRIHGHAPPSSTAGIQHGSFFLLALDFVFLAVAVIVAICAYRQMLKTLSEGFGEKRS